MYENTYLISKVEATLDSYMRAGQSFNTGVLARVVILEIAKEIDKANAEGKIHPMSFVEHATEWLRGEP